MLSLKKKKKKYTPVSRTNLDMIIPPLNAHLYMGHYKLPSFVDPGLVAQPAISTTCGSRLWPGSSCGM